MNTAMKYVSNGAGALVMTAGLALAMANLIHIEFVDLPDKQEKLSMVVNADITPPPEIAPKQKASYEKVETPPAIVRLDTATTGRVVVPKPDFGSKIPLWEDLSKTIESVKVSVDFSLSPIFRAKPIMPSRAERSGHCNVKFDVNADGNTYNVRVLNCSQSLFARASIKAAQKWKYRPQTIDGKSVPRTGLRTMITFNLSDENGRLIPQ